MPENSKRRNQENTGNRRRVMYLYFDREERSLVKGEWRESRGLDHKLLGGTLNGTYTHYCCELWQD